MGDVMQDQRDHLPADQQHDHDECRDLAECDGDCQEQVRRIWRVPGAFEHAGEHRQQHQHQHHAEVLDDEPADGDAPALGVKQPPLLEEAQQHHGAGDGQRDAEDEAGTRRPALPPADGHAQWRRHQRLCERAGNSDGADREQVFERKMQAHSEHQQDDADFGELIGSALVSDKARGEWADGDAREQITDQRWQPQALGHEPETQGKYKAKDQGRDERGRMRHSKTPLLEGRHRPGKRQTCD